MHVLGKKHAIEPRFLKISLQWWKWMQAVLPLGKRKSAAAAAAVVLPQELQLLALWDTSLAKTESLLTP
jgi:hypothetical protein